MMSTVDDGAEADAAGGGSADKDKADDEAGGDKGSTSPDDMGDEEQPDYYDVLGVAEEATPTEIKVGRTLVY